ncbi:creatininase family protein [Methylopila sp. M107]|uniref:creatininase family protein n=1 Tax=Methylopila sp. M107 TaxID=1101190 RepID=UPI000362CE4C|nr:creatininase family protein [Methylopila sp. M107]
MTSPRRRWIEMTTEDFSSAGVADWIAVLPVAAVEQHGPHLPLGVDGFVSDGHLERAAALIPAELPVTFLPTQWIGASEEHADFRGTLSVAPETLISAWTDIGASVARAGVRKIVLVNSHGGNSPVLDVVARRLRARHGMLAVVASWRRFGHPNGLFSAEEIRHDIHAGRIETSLMKAFRPDLVREDRAGTFVPATVGMESEFSQLRASAPAGFGWLAQDLHPSGATGDAAAATPAAGEASADHGAAAFVALLGDVARFDLSRLTNGPA